MDFTKYDFNTSETQLTLGQYGERYDNSSSLSVFSDLLLEHPLKRFFGSWKGDDADKVVGLIRKSRS